ncbi:MAG TPA: class I SAM-dependent methyltransferase [Vicinamibacterales bacterium]|jgi:ubiquinone/menaquinone biosynthesis C-methylase UbiE
MPTREGWKGWDEYAPFYDWENARTLGRRDVAFWRSVAKQARGPVLELGCGTGRISLPLARDGVSLVGIDRSSGMLERARRRAGALTKTHGGRSGRRLRLVRGDIRALPFGAGEFRMVLAPYGILQSLLRDRDLTSTLASVARVLAPGGLFGIDLVPDVPNWREYSDKVQLKGRAAGGAHLTLIESVRQDRRRHLTTFTQTYRRRRGREVTEHAFDLTFRTLPVRSMTRRLTDAGFAIDALLGDYRGAAWDERADVWIILARRALPAAR